MRGHLKPDSIAANAYSEGAGMTNGNAANSYRSEQAAAGIPKSCCEKRSPEERLGDRGGGEKNTGNDSSVKFDSASTYGPAQSGT
jgi:hypothetical protein